MPDRAYWSDRYRRQGDLYVAQGGRQKIYDEQMGWIPPILEKHLSGARVLDFGCGPGRFRGVIERTGAEYVGVDLIPGLGTLPLGDSLPRGFDCALAVMVLQHITDDTGYAHWCRELHECLNPGGHLLAIDHLQQKGMEAHMRPRGMKAIMRTAPWSGMQQIGEHDGHWIGTFRK